jgi:hypothetical protein
VFCGEVMPWDKRGDAVYCSPRCSKRAQRALKRPLKELRRIDILNPPFDGYNSETDVYRIEWESPVVCDGCGHFMKNGVVLSVHGSPRFFRACGFKCLRALVDAT